MMAETARQPVVVVAGPTASGKSGLAADIADAFGGVVINADSMQVYRGLEVLSAAPDAAARARVPHRLYGVLDPAEPCSAGWWRARAMEEIAAARRDGKLAVLCGGTGLYLRALMTGLAHLPPVPGDVRDAIRARLARLGPAPLHAELAGKDPVSAARIEPTDPQRVARALEVLEATGRPLSDWQRAQTPAPDTRDIAFFTILLLPPRTSLYVAIDARFAAMIDDGGLDEVRALLKRGLDPALPAMKALGVPDLIAYLGGEISFDDAVRRGQQVTRRYAKRQFTWFRNQIITNLTENKQYMKRDQIKIFPLISKFVLTCSG
ncbi:MAG: tRNA (adenosine(37)-N6)-dimethylallyltransferase MiaA [Alphaproteobacteria bacterium]